MDQNQTASAHFNTAAAQIQFLLRRKKRVRWQNKYNGRLMVVFEAKWAGETLGDTQTELRANYSLDDSHE